MNYDEFDSLPNEEAGGTYSTGRPSEKPRPVGRAIASSLLLALGCVVIGLLSAGMIPNLISHLAARSTPEAPTPPDAAAQENAAAQAASESVVSVSNGTASCSGIIVEADAAVADDSGYILTSCHIVGSGDAITVRTEAGSDYPASVEGKNDSLGLALLKVSTTEELPGAKFVTPAPAAKKGVTAYCLSAASEGVSSVSVHYAQSEQTNRGKAYTILSTDIAPDDQCIGGPLLDANGCVLGIFLQASDSLSFRADGAGLALDIIDAYKWIRRTLLNPVVSLGLHGNMVTATEYESLRFPCAGFYVESVEEKSAAQQAGVLDGDFIVAVEIVDAPADSAVLTAPDEYPVDSLDALTALNAAYNSGKTVRLVIRRCSSKEAFYAELKAS